MRHYSGDEAPDSTETEDVTRRSIKTETEGAETSRSPVHQLAKQVANNHNRNNNTNRFYTNEQELRAAASVNSRSITGRLLANCSKLNLE